MKKHILNHLEMHHKALEHIQAHMVDRIGVVAELMADLLSKGNKILLFGNGGSAADAQHFAAELVGRFAIERRPIAAIALTTDSSILTAIGNDYGFEQVFNRQIDALAQPGDLVMGISTSGSSPNVLNGLNLGREIGATTLSLVGCGGGKMAAVSDYCLAIPLRYTPVIQEAHIIIMHILCDLIERKLFGEGAEV